MLRFQEGRERDERESRLRRMTAERPAVGERRLLQPTSDRATPLQENTSAGSTVSATIPRTASRR